MNAYFYILAAVFGAVFGSFINCAAYRIVRHENFMKGHSRCTSCGHPLAAADLVPVLSYIFLKGKCRYCGAKISARYPATELLMAGTFAAIAARFGVSTASLRYMGLAVILLGLSLADLESLEIPDGFILAGIIWWAATIPLTAGGRSQALPGTALRADDAANAASVISLTHLGSAVDELRYGLIGAFAIAGGMLILVLIFDRVSGKESMGGGDIKLYFMTGLYLGAGIGLFSVILGAVIGLLVIAVRHRERIPFGPSISAATMISLFAGHAAVSWYAGLF